MAFRPQVNDQLTINGVTYSIAEHPAAPGVPYGQAGRQAIVYQLISPSPSQGEGRGGGPDRRALKVFKPRYRLPEMASVAEHIAPYAGLPGLQVCRRTVLVPQQHAPLLRQHPDLTYGVLMPWIEGPTWMEVLGEKGALSPEESLDLAHSLAGTLAEMEQKGLAHCDLSGSNVMLPVLAQSGSVSQAHFVELVDVEQIYSSDLKRPELLPGGSPGYAHKTAPQGLWSATADRFAGAVLLAEMLGWCDERVREAAWGENYFDPQEVQRGESERYRLLVDVMRQTWGAGAARLFERAWRSDVLNDCATFGEWLVTLPEEVPVVEAAPPAEEAEGEQEKALENEGALQVLMGLARRFEEQGNTESALQTYRQAQTLAPAGSGLAEELALIVQDVETRQAQAAVPEPKPPEEVEAEPIIVEPQLVEEAAEKEPIAPASQSALEAELALIEQDEEARREELPAPGLELPPEEIEAAEVAPLPPVDEETDLDGLFDNGLAAYRREEWAKAQELLAEVVRRRPGYVRDGRKASGLLAEAEKHLAPPHRRVPVWAWALGGLAVLALAVAAILGVAVAIGSIGQTVVREVEVTATPTVVAVVEATDTPRPTATNTTTHTPQPTRTSTATPLARETVSLPDGRFCDWFDGTTVDSRWEWLDPLGGSEVRIGHQGLTIETSSGGRDLYMDNLSAPRLLQTISADDFSVQARVTIQSHFATGVMAFQGGGLLLFRDSDNYVWVALGTSIPDIDSVQVIHGRRDVLTWPSDRPDIEEPSVYLRMTRKSGIVSAAYSLDGETWIESTGVSFPSGEVQVGMVLFSAWDSPGFWARFDSFLWEECIEQPSSPAAESTTAEVFADRGWQDTSVQLQSGDQVVVEYVSGRWTYCGNRYSPYDGTGPPDTYICAEWESASDCVEPVPDFPAGALVGRVGHQLLGIGNRLVLIAESAGNLELRINDGDEGLYDNAGSIIVRITVQHP